MEINQIKVPKFWESIEKSLSLDVDGISEIKDVLTVLKYTTAESIMKFEKMKEIRCIELEYLNKRSEIVHEYPHLKNFTFASGVDSILSDIASKIKKIRHEEHEIIDIEPIVEKVLADAKKIVPSLSRDSVLVEPDSNKSKCSIRCPKCKKLVALSPYYTTKGIGYRAKNFARHVANSHGDLKQSPVKKQVVPTKSLNRKHIAPCQNDMNRRKLIAKSIRYASKNRLLTRSTPTTLPDNIELEKSNGKLFDGGQILESENDQLKKSISDLEKENQNIVVDLENARKRIMQLESRSQLPVDDAQVEKWRQRATNFEMELKKSQSELQKSHMIRRDLLHSMLELQGKVRVVARLRPVARSGINEMQFKINSNQNELKIQKNGEERTFKFDHIFDANQKQSDVFEMISPLVRSAIDGYSICIFTYGQTGAGKTFTMIGDMDTDPGIVPRTIDMLFSQFHEKPFGFDYSLSFSMFEIYNDKLYDLLENEHNATTHNDTIKLHVADKNEFHQLWSKGMQRRTTGLTAGNVSSSRSHAFTQLHVNGGNQNATISLVDLAGSESPKTSENMEETKAINSSLSALNGILKGSRKNQVGDFTQCTLTKILKPCFKDKSKTMMIANLSTEEVDINATINTARFAQLK